MVVLIFSQYLRRWPGAGVGAGVGAALAHWIVHLAPAASLFLLEVNWTVILPAVCWVLNFFFLENLQDDKRYNHYVCVRIRSYRKCEFLLCRFGLPFLDIKKISIGDLKRLTLHIDLLAWWLHDVVDLAVHVFGVLAIIVGVEGEDVPRPDIDCLLHIIRGTSKI